MSEMKVLGQIEPIAMSYGASVYKKIRIADVVDIDQLSPRGQGTFALQSHFDYVIADDNEQPLFAIEFDGGGHSTSNDARKDDICRQAELTLFRIGLSASRAEPSTLSFVAYFVHLWFLALEFKKMQDEGRLPPDEPFFMSGFLRPNAKNIFDSEFDLLGPARGRFNTFCRANSQSDHVFSHLGICELLLFNESDGLIAFTSYEAGGAKIYGRSNLDLKVPSFGPLAEIAFVAHELGQFCTALAIDDLVSELRFHREAGHVVRRRVDILAELTALKARGYNPLLAGGGDPDFQIVWS